MIILAVSSPRHWPPGWLFLCEESWTSRHSPRTGRSRHRPRVQRGGRAGDYSGDTELVAPREGGSVARCARDVRRGCRVRVLFRALPFSGEGEHRLSMAARLFNVEQPAW